jgi:hypothetical protein
MGKKEESKKEQKPVISSFLEDMLNHGRALQGDRLFTVNDSEKFATGIPFEHFSMMYLFMTNVFPLSKIIGIAGPAGSNKSSLAFTFVRMICDYNGMAKLVECEGGKYSPQLIESILGTRYVQSNRLLMNLCANIDDAQKVMSETEQGLAKFDPERSIPFGVVVDSLTGTETEGETHNIAEEGFAGRAHPISALSWTRYFKKYSADLIGRPMSFIFVNHRKEKPPAPGSHGPPQKRTPGGDGQWFHSAVYIYTDCLKQAKAATRNIEGETLDCPNEYRTIRMHTEKNSLAPGKRTIISDFIWYYDEDGTQHSYFDFDAATTYIIEDSQSAENKNVSLVERKALREFCDITSSKGIYTSKALKIEGANSTTIGAAIRKDPEMMKKLMLHFHISTYPVFETCDLDTVHDLPLPRQPGKKGEKKTTAFRTDLPEPVKKKPEKSKPDKPEEAVPVPPNVPGMDEPTV